MQKNIVNRPRLILISDLWGKEKSEWITYYITNLSPSFDVRYYDSCDLGRIDKSDYVEDKLHHQFVNGGVEKAIENVLEMEKETINVLGFSIGGYIAWKACLSGLKVQNLFSISATRLRLEIAKPKANIQLFYGENDSYKPDQNWFKKMKIKENLFPNQSHELYKEKHIAEEICKQIVW